MVDRDQTNCAARVHAWGTVTEKVHLCSRLELDTFLAFALPPIAVPSGICPCVSVCLHMFAKI